MSPSEEQDNISRSRSPSVSLFFEEDDSLSDNSSTGPRRRCSVSSCNRPMDLRYPASVSGDKSYDLSVCSDDNSFSTLKTEDAFEKMGMFEVALSAGYKKKDDECAIIRSNSNPEVKGGWLHKVRMKRHTLDHGGAFRHSPVVLAGTGDDDDSCVVKKSKTFRKKVTILRCCQAAATVLLLSTVIASIVFFETIDTDPLSFFAMLPAEISSTMANLFGSASGQEVEEVERVMVQQMQTMMHEELPPVDNHHEYDRFFVQAFRNNQKITHRLDKDPTRQRKMRTNENNFNHMDKQRFDRDLAQIRIKEFLDNQKLAQEGTHLKRRK
eukprot:scaffold5181_cov148-Skeletonema_menzelii.AAC.2